MALSKFEEIKAAAESDLVTFIKLVAPHRVLGAVHEKLIRWWYRGGRKKDQIVLLPRGHQKSIMVAYRAAFEITRNPAVTILYISSTSGLAEQQLKAIKDILTSPIYRRYWPDMVNEDEGKREKWTTSAISVDHPKRASEGVRDPTVFTAGLTTNIVGFHCDIAICDDIVTDQNAYTEEGRSKTRQQYSLLASIKNPDSETWVAGTRYHPKDLYSDMIASYMNEYDENGDIVNKEPIFEVMQEQVESSGDGTGEFLWPRQRRKDGSWFGFSKEILAKKSGEYIDRAAFRAQYYNDPNDPESMRIAPGSFQYYDRTHLSQSGDTWFLSNRKLYVCAAMDFAFTKNKKSDYTVLIVCGMDSDGNIYVLDIYRDRIDRVSEYYAMLYQAVVKWNFSKIKLEVTAGQRVIAEELKDLCRKDGLLISFDDFSPNKGMGSKEERISHILEPRYDQKVVWHYKGGNCQVLEEELVLERPPNDDIKDALASCVSILKPAMQHRIRAVSSNVVSFNRFGGGVA